MPLSRPRESTELLRGLARPTHPAKPVPAFTWIGVCTGDVLCTRGLGALMQQDVFFHAFSSSPFDPFFCLFSAKSLEHTRRWAPHTHIHLRTCNAPFPTILAALETIYFLCCSMAKGVLACCTGHSGRVCRRPLRPFQGQSTCSASILASYWAFLVSS